MRWAPRVVTILSLLLCAAAIFLWWRSHVVTDAFEWIANQPTFHDHIAFISSNGQLTFYREHFDDPSTAAPYQFRWTNHDWRMLRSFRPDTIELLGFSIARSKSQITSRYAMRLIEISVPYWFLTVLFAIPLLMTLRQSRRRRGRLRAGLCPTCGYDLRGLSDRCPECGSPIASSLLDTPRPAS